MTSLLYGKHTDGLTPILGYATIYLSRKTSHLAVSKAANGNKLEKLHNFIQSRVFPPVHGPGLTTGCYRSMNVGEKARFSFLKWSALGALVALCQGLNTLSRSVSMNQNNVYSLICQVEKAHLAVFPGLKHSIDNPLLRPGERITVYSRMHLGFGYVYLFTTESGLQGWIRSEAVTQIEVA